MNESTAAELDELEKLIARLRASEFTASEFRAQSVHYGVYTQRQSQSFFVRLRVPHGIISAYQLDTLATLLESVGLARCHVTTRQGVEIHDLPLEQILPLLRGLAEVGLLSHETGGNAVRGITVCPHAGVEFGEPFDVTPHAALLTRCFIRHPSFQMLPRKIKIGFSCCAADCARSLVQDLGFQARLGEQGEPGFRVLAGGGTGALPRLAQPLCEFLPASLVAPFTEAFLRVFDRLGERQNRARARVKFLMQELGLGVFRETIVRECERLCATAQTYPNLEDVSDAPGKPQPTPSQASQRSQQPNDAHEFSAWADVQTQPQRQPGFRTVRISLTSGQIETGQLRQLAIVLRQFGLTVRTTPEQGFLLRWVREEQLPGLYQALNGARLLPRLGVSRLVVCPGSSSCSNAFTHAPGLAQALTARLAALPARPEMVGQLRIRLSGCPNGCSLHAVADLGLEGIALRDGEQWLPAYRIWVGGRESQQHARLATDLGLVPARHVPSCVAELADYFLRERQGQETFADLVERVGVDSLEPFIRKHQLEAAPERSSLRIDWGESGPYRPRHAKAAGVC